MSNDKCYTMSFNLESCGGIKSLYGLKTKETIENIADLQDRVNIICSSAESDEEDLHHKENRQKLNCADAVSIVIKPKKTKKKKSKKRKNEKETLVNSIIIEDEIDDYVPIGEKFGENSDKSNVVDTDVIYIVDSPITVINDEQNCNINGSSPVVSSVIVLDDSPCISISPQLSAVEQESQSDEEQALRRSKRVRSTTKRFVNEFVVQSDRSRRKKKRVTSSDDIPVVIIDEDYAIPQCSYFLPKQKTQSKEDSNKSVDYDTTSDTVTVFVNWRSQECEKFEIPRYRALKSIFKHYAEKESIPLTCVVLTKDSEMLTPKDSPDSANFKCVQYLQGFKASVEQHFENQVAKPVVMDKNDVELKVLLQNKRPLMLTVKMNQPMKVIVAKCASQLDCSEEDVVLFVDGEKIDLEETPQDLDLQSGECVDAHVKK